MHKLAENVMSVRKVENATMQQWLALRGQKNSHEGVQVVDASSTALLSAVAG